MKFSKLISIRLYAIILVLCATTSLVANTFPVSYSGELHGEKKRFLIICENFERLDEPEKVIGGVEKVIAQVTLGLQQRGFEVGYMDIPLDTFTVPGTQDLQSPYLWGIKPKIAQKISTFKPDYILIPLHGVMSYQAATYCAANGIPFTAFYPARLPDICKSNFHIPYWLSNYFVNKFLAAASNVLVPAASMRDELQQEGIKNVIAWPHGVMVDVFRNPSPEEKAQALIACNLQDKPHPFYLYVARLSPEKNIQDFLDIKVPGTKILVGPEDMGYSITELQARYPDIVITGPKKDKDLLNYYHSADIFLFTSKKDSFGLVMLEALACGLPVVAFETTGPVDVAPRGSGVSYLAGDCEGLSACAVHAWNDLCNGTITAQQCRAYAAQFTWDAAIDMLLNNVVLIDQGIYQNRELFEQDSNTALWVIGALTLTAAVGLGCYVYAHTSA